MPRSNAQRIVMVIWCHALWCGECKQVRPATDAMTQELGGRREKGPLVQVNIEEATAVCDGYGNSDVSF